MLWIIGGTAETGELLKRISGQTSYIVTVATSSGKEVLPDEEYVVVARMDSQAMCVFIRENSIDTVVDMTHPYAVEVTHNARKACQKCEVRYFRYVRERSTSPGVSNFNLITKSPISPTNSPVFVSSIAECVEFLKWITGCTFFTTGSKNIKDFQEVRGQNRFVYRVLPTPSSIEECTKHHVEMKDIVAILGPVSEELNVAMFKGYHADYVVMKDSGKTGGTPEKLNACRRLGIVPIIIGRPDEDGISDLESLAKMLVRNFSLQNQKKADSANLRIKWRRIKYESS